MVSTPLESCNRMIAVFHINNSDWWVFAPKKKTKQKCGKYCTEQQLLLKLLDWTTWILFFGLKHTLFFGLKHTWILTKSSIPLKYSVISDGWKKRTMRHTKIGQFGGFKFPAHVSNYYNNVDWNRILSEELDVNITNITSFNAI